MCGRSCSRMIYCIIIGESCCLLMVVFASGTRVVSEKSEGYHCVWFGRETISVRKPSELGERYVFRDRWHDFASTAPLFPVLSVHLIVCLISKTSDC